MRIYVDCSQRLCKIQNMEQKKLKNVFKKSDSSTGFNDKFQEKLYAWFEDKDLMSELRAHLRLKMITALKESAFGLQFLSNGRIPKPISPKLQALNLLIADFFLQQQYHYSLSVLITEVPHLCKVTEFSSYFSKVASQNVKDLGTFEAPPRFHKKDVIDILQALGFPEDSHLSIKARRMYQLNRENKALLTCLIECFQSEGLISNTQPKLDKKKERYFEEQKELNPTKKTIDESINSYLNEFQHIAQALRHLSQKCLVFFSDPNLIRKQSEDKSSEVMAVSPNQSVLCTSPENILFQQLKNVINETRVKLESKLDELILKLNETEKGVNSINSKAFEANSIQISSVSKNEEVTCSRKVVSDKEKLMHNVESDQVNSNLNPPQITSKSLPTTKGKLISQTSKKATSPEYDDSPKISKNVEIPDSGAEKSLLLQQLNIERSCIQKLNEENAFLKAQNLLQNQKIIALTNKAENLKLSIKTTKNLSFNGVLSSVQCAKTAPSATSAFSLNPTIISSPMLKTGCQSLNSNMVAENKSMPLLSDIPPEFNAPCSNKISGQPHTEVVSNLKNASAIDSMDKSSELKNEETSKLLHENKEANVVTNCSLPKSESKEQTTNMFQPQRSNSTNHQTTVSANPSVEPNPLLSSLLQPYPLIQLFCPTVESSIPSASPHAFFSQRLNVPSHESRPLNNFKWKQSLRCTGCSDSIEHPCKNTNCHHGSMEHYKYFGKPSASCHHCQRNSSSKTQSKHCFCLDSQPETRESSSSEINTHHVCSCKHTLKPKKSKLKTDLIGASYDPAESKFNENEIKNRKKIKSARVLVNRKKRSEQDSSSVHFQQNLENGFNTNDATQEEDIAASLTSSNISKSQISDDSLKCNSTNIGKSFRIIGKVKADLDSKNNSLPCLENSILNIKDDKNMEMVHSDSHKVPVMSLINSYDAEEQKEHLAKNPNSNEKVEGLKFSQPETNHSFQKEPEENDPKLTAVEDDLLLNPILNRTNSISDNAPLNVSLKQKGTNPEISLVHFAEIDASDQIKPPSKISSVNSTDDNVYKSFPIKNISGRLRNISLCRRLEDYLEEILNEMNISEEETLIS